MNIRKNEDWLMLGKVGKPYGLQGYFFVSQMEQDLQLEVSEVLVGNSFHSARLTKVKELRLYKGRFLLSLEAIEDRTVLDTFRGQNLWLSKEAVYDPMAAYLNRQVVDCSQKPVGTLQQVVDHGAGPNGMIYCPLQGTLELPLIEDYFKLEEESDKPLRLCQSKDFFADLWHKPSQ